MLNSFKYDAFVSHAVDDKKSIANELCAKLERKGLKIWYSSSNLTVGDHVNETIHEGLQQCRFGIVVVSPNYLAKVWPLTEFSILLQRERKQKGRKVVLPVLHGITSADISTKAPEMSNSFSVNAAEGIDHVVTVLYNEIQRQKKQIRRRFRQRVGVVSVLFLLLVLGIFYSYTNLYTQVPNENSIEAAIQKRIHDLQQQADLNLQELTATHNLKPTTSEDIGKVYTDFKNVKSYYRNEYFVNTGHQTIRAKKNVEAALGITVDTFTPYNQYQLTVPASYQTASGDPSLSTETNFVYYNTQPVTYTIVKSEPKENIRQVTVVYTQNIRLISITLLFPSPLANTKRHQVMFTSLLPIETFFFEVKDGVWVVTRVE